MGEIVRMNLDDQFANTCAYSEVVAAGDWVYLNFCVGNVGESVEAQVHGALDNMEARLALVGLTLDSVIATEFAHQGGEKGLQVQIDAIAYRGK